MAALEGHWDALELRAWTTDERGRHLYQQGRLETLMAVPQLTRRKSKKKASRQRAA